MKKAIAKKLINKYQPTVVFVVGTWGKSMAIAAMQILLSKSGKSYLYRNTNDLALAVRRGGFFSSLLDLFLKRDYPQYIFVELHGLVDGDYELLSLIKSKILWITHIGQNDCNQVGGMKKYLQKCCLVNIRTAPKMSVVYNSDIEQLPDVLKNFAFKQELSFGVVETDSDFRAQSINFRFSEEADYSHDGRVQGMVMKISNGGSSLPMRINGVIGQPYVYTILASLALAKVMAINMVDSLSSLRDIKLLPGRLRLIPGIKKTLLVDDTYDSDPESAFITFREGGSIPLKEGQKRIAVLGDMKHVGAQTEEAHCLLGEELAGLDYDMIIAIGEKANDVLKCAKTAGMEDNQLFHFMDQVEAGKFVQEVLRQGDLVIVKGSREAKLESVVKELMAFPLKWKDDLLVR